MSDTPRTLRSCNQRVKGDRVARLLSALGEHAEDTFLLSGSACLGLGVGIAFGYEYGLVVVGTLAVAYGVWITERRT